MVFKKGRLSWDTFFMASCVLCTFDMGVILYDVIRALYCIYPPFCSCLTKIFTSWNVVSIKKISRAFKFQCADNLTSYFQSHVFLFLHLYPAQVGSTYNPYFWVVAFAPQHLTGNVSNFSSSFIPTYIWKYTLNNIYSNNYIVYCYFVVYLKQINLVTVILLNKNTVVHATNIN